MLVCETHVCLHQSGSHSWFEMGNQYKMPGSHHEMTYASSCNSARRKLNFFFFTLKHQVVPRRLARFPGIRDGLGPGQRQQTALLLGCWHPLALEEKEATHSRILAGLQSTGPQSRTLLSNHATTTALLHFPWLFSMSQLSTGNPISLLLITEEVLWNGYSTFLKGKKSP